MTCKIDNYDLARRRAQQEFLAYDQEHMIERFGLKADEKYLWLHYVDGTYRIDRSTGCTCRVDEDGKVLWEATFNESMAIWDLLCNAQEGCHLAGTFGGGAAANNFSSKRAYSSELFPNQLKLFDEDVEALSAACATFGEPWDGGKGDVNFRFKVFDCLPVAFSFWCSDDEFDACFNFYWDANFDQFIRYETTWYCQHFIVDRILAAMS